jgi:hypothetical protein
MSIEIITIIAMLVGGSALIRVVGVRGWALPFLGFITGLCTFIIFGMFQAITPLTSNPILTIALTAIVPLLIWGVCVRLGKDVGISLRASIIVVIAFVLAVLLVRESNLVNWHTDSFRYIMTSSLIAGDNYDSVSVNLVTKRMLSVPLIHSPAHLVGEYYLRSVTPLLALSTLGTVAWMLWAGMKRKLNKKTLTVFVIAGLLLLATTNRFVFHAFYINGHLLFGVLVLILAGSSWLLAMNKDVPRKALLTLMAIAIPALVVTRAEASLVAGLALLPLLLSNLVTFRHKAILLGVLGASMVVWQSFSTLIYIREGVDVHVYTYGLLIAGIGVLMAIPLLRWKQLTKHSEQLLWLTEGTLWLTVLLLNLKQPDLLLQSFKSIIQNVLLGSGSWGASFVLLSVLFMGVLLFARMPHQVYLRFAVTTFVPLALLLVLLQEGSYRAGNGDSLNRMWIQVIPLAVVYITAAMAIGQWRIKIDDVKHGVKRLVARK